MSSDDQSLPSVGTILGGAQWPTRVRVVRVVARGSSRTLIEAVTLDGRSQLLSRIFRNDELATLEVVAPAELRTFDGDPLGFRLAAEATRIRLAYTYDPQFAVNVARIDPLPHQLEAVYHYMLRQPRLRFLLADDPGAGKTIMAGLLLKELKLRGATTRTLIVAPANLVSQWQRELENKFDERFDVIERGVLNTRGSHAWELGDQSLVSIDFAWQPDVMESLARAQRWDLVIVDEAHKMAAYKRGNKLDRTRRYRLGELLTEQTEHLLLMTATPHKGDPENFRLLLQLLDPDLFANTEILAQAVQRKENPIFLRRLKEDMTDFEGRPLFPPRHVQTLGIELTPAEQQLYEHVTRYVQENFNRALAEENRNVTFALIILQRRLASSVRAIRRSLENRRNRLVMLRDEVVANPQLLEVARNRTSNLDELPDDALEQERWRVEEEALRWTVATDLGELESEIRILDKLATQALFVEEAGPEGKLQELLQVVERLKLFQTGEKLLIFTEAKDTLDYLVENLVATGLSVTTIHGNMETGERYAAENEFATDAQVMVATEAAGEGINLQFCHLMINYDLPWTPTRLEQRMGRIHRYGQQYEVFIYNLVATSTREGMVLHALMRKLEEMRQGLGDEKVFDVLDQLLEGVPLERLLRDALANRLSFEEVRERILARLDESQMLRLQDASLFGLATRYVDLHRLREDRQIATEARLSPAYVRAFFTQAIQAIAPGRLEQRDDGFWRIPYVPSALRDVPDVLQRRYGRPAESYAAITFDKRDMQEHRHLTLIGPGQALFESVVDTILERYSPELTRGTVLRDPAGDVEGFLWLLVGAVEDGSGAVAGKQIFALFQELDGTWRQVAPARLLDFEPLSEVLQIPPAYNKQMDSGDSAIEWSLSHVLEPYLEGLRTERRHEIDIVRTYLHRSFDVLIARSQGKLMEYQQRARNGTDMTLSIQEEQRHLDDLRRRQQTRSAETERMAVLALNEPQILGVAAIVLPTIPELTWGNEQPTMRRDDAVEAAAMERVMAYEADRGWSVEDVHEENRGYDLISRSQDGQIRYIEIKGRAGIGGVELSENEWLKAEQLGDDYWLYIVTNALHGPDLYLIRDPAHRLPRQEIVPRVRYGISQQGWHHVAEEAVVYKS